MARKLGSPSAAVTPASRSTSPGWRDPRLWIGVAIVAASVVVGSRVLASADDTVQVWAVTADVDPGQELGTKDLRLQRLRFADAADADRYFLADDELPDDLTAVHGLGEGELLPRAAIGAVTDDGTSTIAIPVSSLLVPSEVGSGSVVDVYVNGDAGAGGAGETRREAGDPVLTRVRVVAVGDDGGAGGAGGERKVELAVPADGVADYYALLDTLTTPVVSLAVVG